MKGRGHRLKHDVRRVWECPACGRRERTGGQVVNRRCPCSEGEGKAAVWMRLVEEPRRAAPATPPAPAAGPDGAWQGGSTFPRAGPGR